MFKRYEKVEGFTTLKGSNGLYSINVEGQIKNIDGFDVQYSKDSEGNALVHCLGWAGEQVYRVADLIVIQFKELYLCEKHYNEINAFHIDGNKMNLCASNIGYRFKCKRIPYEVRPGSFYVPSLTFLAITEDGRIFNTKTDYEYNWQVDSGIYQKSATGGYRRLNIVIENKRYNVSRHRLLMLTFKDYPSNVDSLTVNHINGIPGDDVLDNLNWSTRSENNRHAVAAGLRTQNEPVLIRNVINNEVIEYPSMAECARRLGLLSTQTVCSRLQKSDFGTIFSDGTQIKLKSDKREWKEIDEIELEKLKANKELEPNLHKKILVRNCRDFIEKEYEHIKYVSKDTHVEYRVIKDSILNRKQEVYNGYQFKSKLDKNPWRIFSELEFKNSLYKSDITIDFRNLITGEEVSFPNIWNAETWLKKDVYTSLNIGKQPLFIDGWQAKLNHWSWETIDDVEGALYRLQKEIMAYDPLTKETIIAANATQLSKTIGGDYSSIRTAALSKGQIPYRGYQIRLGVSNDPWPTFPHRLAIDI